MQIRPDCTLSSSTIFSAVFSKKNNFHVSVANNAAIVVLIHKETRWRLCLGFTHLHRQQHFSLKSTSHSRELSLTTRYWSRPRLRLQQLQRDVYAVRDWSLLEMYQNFIWFLTQVLSPALPMFQTSNCTQYRVQPGPYINLITQRELVFWHLCKKFYSRTDGHVIIIALQIRTLFAS